MYNKITLSFIIVVLSIANNIGQQCQDFNLIFQPYPLCSGDQIYMSADYFNNSGITVTDTTFKWSIDNVEVSEKYFFDTTFYNLTNSDLVLSFNFRGEAEAGSCVFDSTFVVVVSPAPQIDFTLTDVLCSGEYNGVIEFSLDSNVTLYDQFGSISLTSPIENLSAGNYNYSLQGNYTNITCFSDTMITITEPAPFTMPNNIVTQNDNCAQGTGKIVFTGLSGGTKPYLFFDTSNPMSPYSTFNDSIIVGLGQGPHFVNLVDDNGCVFQITNATNGIVVNTFNNQKPETPIYNESYKVCEGGTLFLYDKEPSNSNLPHYYFFPSGQLNNRITVDGEVSLTSVEASQDSVLVRAVGKIGAPNSGCLSDIYRIDLIQEFCLLEDSLSNKVTTNAFSPNGDLLENATFKIDLDLLSEGEDNIVTIYNRWGDIVFKKENYNNTDVVWHGDNLSGDSMPEGTYFYTLEIPNKEFTTSGWVYLDR